MGITGELVRNVFLKSRCVQSHESHVRRNAMEKKRWSTSVRSYLCGDENNSSFRADGSGSFRSLSIIDSDLVSFRSNRATNTSSIVGEISSAYMEEDTSSVKSSEGTVNQPAFGDSKDENPKERQNSAYKLFQQDDAALIIQSAFRNFRARRVSNVYKNEGKCSPSRESVGTSVEVQTGNSSDIFSIKEESFDVCHQMRHKARAQVLKLQEEWDDSTVSSGITKMRIQSKLEAATRRERALAYAFSQQLRICSKRKQSTINEANIGWNWLERWMAARQMDDQIHINKTEVVSPRSLIDTVSVEEKESCGSNEVSSLFEMKTNVSANLKNNIPRPNNPRRKFSRSLSRQSSSTSSHLCPRGPRDMKKVCQMDDAKNKRKRAKQPGGSNRDAITHVAEELEAKLNL